MHGPMFKGDGAPALEGLAEYYAMRVSQRVTSAGSFSDNMSRSHEGRVDRRSRRQWYQKDMG